MPKILKLNASNIEEQKRQFENSDMMDGAEGMYLLVEFGVTEHFTILNSVALDKNYRITGDRLENGWVGVERV